MILKGGINNMNKKALLPVMMFGLVLSLSLVAAAPVEKSDGFVCPVITSDAAGTHNPNAVQIGEGHYSVIGPEVSVPTHATNGDGAGTPPGPHSQPEDPDYTAIWAVQ